MRLAEAKICGRIMIVMSRMCIDNRQIARMLKLEFAYAGYLCAFVQTRQHRSIKNVGFRR